MQALSIATVGERLDAEPVVGPWECSREQYHADRMAVCHSSLQDFRKSVPLFAGRYITGTMPPREETDALRLGTALHLAVLEPAKFAADVVTAPSGINRRTNEGKAAWARFQLDAAGKTVLDAEDYDQVCRMADAVRQHGLARAALDRAGPVEYPIRWKHPSGLWVRNLIDKLIPADGLLVDVKTASDPSPEVFAKSCAAYGYHSQAALYTRGAREALGIVGDFLHIVVGKEEPHEVACYLLHADAMEMGRRENDDAIDEIAERRRTGDWSSRLNTVNPIYVDLPKWLYLKETA